MFAAVSEHPEGCPPHAGHPVVWTTVPVDEVGGVGAGEGVDQAQ